MQIPSLKWLAVAIVLVIGAITTGMNCRIFTSASGSHRIDRMPPGSATCPKCGASAGLVDMQTFRCHRCGCEFSAARSP